MSFGQSTLSNISARSVLECLTAEKRFAGAATHPEAQCDGRSVRPPRILTCQQVRTGFRMRPVLAVQWIDSIAEGTKATWIDHVAELVQLLP